MIHPHADGVGTPDEALKRLNAGNTRLVRGESHVPHLPEELLADLVKAPHPLNGRG